MRLALLLAWLPALALAQTTTGLTLQLQGQSSKTITQADCGSTVQIAWTAAVSGVACGDLVIWASTATCGDAPASGDFQIADIASTTWASSPSGTQDVAISDLPIGGVADGGTGGCGAAVETTINLCAATKIAGYDCSYQQQTVRASPQATIVYDAVPPAAPTLAPLEALDSALEVSVTFPSDAALVGVEYRAQGGTDFRLADTISSESPHLRISGLTNGTTYDVRAYAQDAAGNKSVYSGVVSGTPKPTVGFWGQYQAANGTDTGGCQAGGAGGALALLALLGLFWRKR